MVIATTGPCYSSCVKPLRASPSTAFALPWIESSDWEAQLDCRPLTSPERELAVRYARDGYVIIDIVDPAFPEFAEQLRSSLEPELAKRDRVHDVWRTQPAARQLAGLPEVTTLLRLLYDREPIPFQTLHFRRGTEQESHSDSLHFHSLPHRFLCAAWIALEDIGPDSGPLHLYPGSHRFPIWELHDLGLPPGSASYPRYERALHATISQLGLPKKVLSVRKGQAVIWAANLLHGGEPIHNHQSTRWSQVTHYFFENCLYYSPLRSDPYAGELRLKHVVDVRTGRTILHVYGGRIFCPTANQRFWMRPSLFAFARAVAASIIHDLRRLIVVLKHRFIGSGHYDRETPPDSSAAGRHEAN